MKGWIEFSTPHNGDVRVKATEINIVCQHCPENSDIPSIDRCNICVGANFTTVLATQEEVFVAIEKALS